MIRKSVAEILDQHVTFALEAIRPVTGRCFFEAVIRGNLDIGRPDQMQLIFDRRVTRRTPGRFRTRVLTEGVVPSLHVEYQRSKVKQYHKEGQALRTETTINDTYDFAIGRALRNLLDAGTIRCLSHRGRRARAVVPARRPPGTTSC
jgi:hypothetical protein